MNLDKLKNIDKDKLKHTITNILLTIAILIPWIPQFTYLFIWDLEMSEQRAYIYGALNYLWFYAGWLAHLFTLIVMIRRHGRNGKDTGLIVVLYIFYVVFNLYVCIFQSFPDAWR